MQQNKKSSYQFDQKRLNILWQYYEPIIWVMGSYVNQYGSRLSSKMPLFSIAASVLIHRA